jgi:hypothetical protein
VTAPAARVSPATARAVDAARPEASRTAKAAAGRGGMAAPARTHEAEADTPRVATPGRAVTTTRAVRDHVGLRRSARTTPRVPTVTVRSAATRPAEVRTASATTLAVPLVPAAVASRVRTRKDAPRVVPAARARTAAEEAPGGTVREASNARVRALNAGGVEPFSAVRAQGRAGAQASRAVRGRAPGRRVPAKAILRAVRALTPSGGVRSPRVASSAATMLAGGAGRAAGLVRAVSPAEEGGGPPTGVVADPPTAAAGRTTAAAARRTSRVRGGILGRRCPTT